MGTMWRTLIYNGEAHNRFLVSSDGQLRNARTGTVYKQTVTNGYYAVCVSLGSRKRLKLIKIHRAIAESFIENPDRKPIINHIDGNKLNNNIENLEWVTYSENLLHAYRTGLSKKLSGERNPMAGLTKEQVMWIRNNYISGDKEYGSRGIARKFGIDHANVLRAAKGISYLDCGDSPPDKDAVSTVSKEN